MGAKILRTSSKIPNFSVERYHDATNPNQGVEAMAATRWILGVSLLSTICVASHQTGTNLVYVHAAVTTNDSFERPITGISHGSFKVLEDNKEQKIEDFSADAIPFSAAIVLDGSRAWKDLARTVVPAVLVKNQRSGDEIL